MGNFIKIDRKMLKWEWYKNEHTKNVFLHCLLKAYWKDTKIEGKTISRGSFVSSIGNMAEELSLTPMEVRTALKHLKSTNEVTSKGTNRNTVFTVTNYDLYQSKEQAEQQTSNKQITIKQQTNNKPLTTNEEYKEDNNINKEKKEDNTKCLEKILQSYQMSDELKNAIIEWVEYKISKKEQYTDLGLEKFIKMTIDEAKKNGELAVIDLINVSISNNYKGIVWESLEKIKNNSKSKRNDKFNNFENRRYDMKNLEKQLLN